MKDKKYIIGFTLILTSFFACVLSYWLVIFAFPVFIFGASIVFISKKTLKRKLLTITLPLLLWFPSTYIFLQLYNYTPPKTFIIPSNYEGTIRIIYEEKCGVTPNKENGRQILKFPSNGILVLNQKFNGGINNDYFLVDRNGNRKEINEILYFKDIKRNIPAIQVGAAGTIGSSTEKGITFSDFYLYQDTTLNKENKVSQRFDSLTNEIVKSCRAK